LRPLVFVRKEEKMNLSIRLSTKIAFLITLVLLCFLISCQQQTKDVMTEQQARALMDRYMDTMNKTDLALVDEIIAPEFVLRSPFLPEPIVGIEGLKALVMNTSKTFSDFSATVEELAVKGDRIWCRFTMKGINTGPLGELPATGKTFHVTGLAITRVVDGKIVEDETFWNVLDFYQQLGFTLTPPQQQE
jgi:steroid delta-isomerase-like uncharacterized protein